MFDKEFFPTPSEVIRKMCEGISFKDCSILDPSAGSGAILDYIQSGSGRYNCLDLYCFEKVPDLASILKDKKYTYLGDDFLKYASDVQFDYILMNPPFSDGDKHLLKAWEIIEQGEIRCLLNEETIKNPYTSTRQILKTIIDNNGTVQYLGDAFKNADRSTSVNIALVSLVKKCDKDRFNFFDNRRGEKDYLVDEGILNNKIARVDIFGNLVETYEQTKKAYIEYAKAKDALYFYLKPLQGEHANIDFIGQSFNEGKTNRHHFNYFVKKLRQLAWSNIFSKTKLRNLATSQVKDDFDKYSESQGQMDFTVENIETLIETLFMNKNMILERCLIEVFDKLCSFDAKNKIYLVNGWKTNDAYKVNQKVILPYQITYDSKWKSWSTSYSRADVLSDIDKAVCLVSGQNFEYVLGIREALSDKFRSINSNKFSDDGKNETDSTFFTIRFFQKGTIHLIFKDVKIWERFNLMAAKGKNWLPDTK